MQTTKAEINRLVDAYWKAVEDGRDRLADYIRQVCLGCLGIDVEEE